jgi:charged multivesicular body protein 6
LQLQIVADKEVEIAKQSLAQGNKKKALVSLKKKKYQEQLLEKTDAQLMNLEELVSCFASFEGPSFLGKTLYSDYCRPTL